jgi:hypothetical protein
MLSPRGASPADPQRLLRPGGTVVIDDLTPADHWPPRFRGEVDGVRMHWLTISGSTPPNCGWRRTSPPWSRPDASGEDGGDRCPAGL